jgi:hypothetical protein
MYGESPKPRADDRADDRAGAADRPGQVSCELASNFVAALPWIHHRVTRVTPVHHPRTRWPGEPRSGLAAIPRHRLTKERAP